MAKEPVVYGSGSEFTLPNHLYKVEFRGKLSAVPGLCGKMGWGEVSPQEAPGPDSPVYDRVSNKVEGEDQPSSSSDHHMYLMVWSGGEFQKFFLI